MHVEIELQAHIAKAIPPNSTTRLLLLLLLNYWREQLLAITLPTAARYLGNFGIFLAMWLDVLIDLICSKILLSILSVRVLENAKLFAG